MKRAALAALLACAAPLVLSCAAERSAARAPRSAQALPERWHYDLWVDKDLDTAVVRLCFYDPVPRRLVAKKRARGFLSDVLDDASNRPLKQDGDAWLMRRGARCVRYKVDLAGAAAFSIRPELAERVGEAIVFTPELVLLRPEHTTVNAEMTLTISTWGDRPVCAPWDRDEKGRYRFGFNALFWRAYVAVGELGLEVVEGGGARLEVAFVDDASFPDRAKYTRWLAGAADAVATLYGKLPADRVQVLVVPTPFPGSDAVTFGMVVRGGYPGAIMLVHDEADAAAFEGDWVAVHELSHLTLPFIEREHMWMSEGFATWAQQVLRVRAGLTDERAAWDRFAHGLARARDGNVRRVPHVYWAGAGWWLLADVYLRERGTSLGEVLRGMRACCFDAPRAVPPAAVIARMDAVAPGFARWAAEEAPALADVPARALFALEKLGVTVDDDGVHLSDDAPGAAMRRAMVERARAPEPPTEM